MLCPECSVVDHDVCPLTQSTIYTCSCCLNTLANMTITTEGDTT